MAVLAVRQTLGARLCRSGWGGRSHPPKPRQGFRRRPARRTLWPRVRSGRLVPRPHTSRH